MRWPWGAALLVALLASSAPPVWAKAAGGLRVALQCVHQHTASLIDFDACELLAHSGGKPSAMHVDPKVFEETEERLAAAVEQSLGRFEAFDRIGTGQAKVDRVASNRRPLDRLHYYATRPQTKYGGLGYLCPEKAYSEGGYEPCTRTSNPSPRLC